MGDILENRPLDWVTAPGDEYLLCNCPPPPNCSASLYISSLWLQTSGTITVEEVASPGGDPNNVSTQEQELMRQWAAQSVKGELGPALRAAEAALEIKFKATDITLSGNAVKLMSKAFKLRAEWIAAGGSACCPPAGSSAS